MTALRVPEVVLPYVGSFQWENQVFSRLQIRVRNLVIETEVVTACSRPLWIPVLQGTSNSGYKWSK